MLSPCWGTPTDRSPHRLRLGNCSTLGEVPVVLSCASLTFSGHTIPFPTCAPVASLTPACVGYMVTRLHVCPCVYLSPSTTDSRISPTLVIECTVTYLSKSKLRPIRFTWSKCTSAAIPEYVEISCINYSVLCIIQTTSLFSGLLQGAVFDGVSQVLL